MSDIYLAISETPTVVTLTSAVINSAVASSVTVTNTVTVALDANSLSALENVTVTVGAAITGTVTVGNSVTIGSLPSLASNTDFVSVGEYVAEGINNYGVIGVQVSNFPATQPISGTVTASLSAGTAQIGSVTASISNFPASTVVSAYGIGSDGTWRGLEMVPGSNRLKVDAANLSGGSSFPISGSVTLGAGTAQIGSVTASISNSVTIASLPAISGTVTANTFALQGTAVTTSNFTSTTASTVLANYNATREVLTIFNEGAGNLHIAPGATCTTVQYQVRLSSGDYYEAPSHQSTITHSAVFATAGTARVTEVS